MAQRFNMDEVVGAYEDDGIQLVDTDSILGGDDMYDDEDFDEDDLEMVGASKLLSRPGLLRKLLRSKSKRRPRFMRIPAKPRWRDQIAPGVPVPGEGLWPLPLNPQANDGVFDAANTDIEFRGTPQKPFRGERLVVVVNRSAGAFNQLRISVITVGTSPQLADIGELAAEAFAPDAFGVRLKLDQAEPGVLYRVLMRVVGAVPAGETIAVSTQVLGQVVRG